MIYFMKTKHLQYSALFWLFFIIISFSWNYYTYKSSTLLLVKNKAQSFFSQILVSRSWNSSHGGVYVPVTPQTQPNPYLSDSLRDVVTTGGLKLTKINPAFMTRQIAEINKLDNDIQFHITSLNPIRPANKADDWESKALLAFGSGKREILELVADDSIPQYRYMAPLVTENSCLKCHAFQGYKVGDIRGGISISFPSAIYNESQKSQTFYLFIAHLLILIIGLAGIFRYFKMTSTYFSIIKTKNEQLEADDILLRQTNLELRESLAQNKATVAAMPDVLFSIDKNGNFLNCQVSNTNPILLNGATLIGKSLDDLLPKPIAKQGIEAIKKAIETNELQIFEYSIDLPKEQQWFELRIVSSASDEVLAISRDITRRKKAEQEIKLKNEELLKLNAEKDKFFSIMAHDLRSPFNGFLGLTQIMAEELSGLTRDEIQKIAVSMRNSATTLFRLLENLLQWSRMSQGLVVFNPEVLKLLPIVVENINMVLISAKNKLIVISYEIPEGLEVFADNNILQTVIRNILSNAVKFTQKGGKIGISVKVDHGNSVEIAIKDSGIGMSPAMIQNLFRIDVQTNRLGTDGEPSTGLGLILCKEFVEKNGGNIWVESVEGKGSVFYFTIPYIGEPKEKKVIKNVLLDDGAENRSKDLKILIAEDDGILEKLITKAVKIFGKEVINARNGVEAVEACRKNPDIDLILMDIKMPEMDGYEATRQIRKFNTSVVIIAQTAFTLAGDRERALVAGCNDYISKPLDLVLLRRLIKKHSYK